MYRDICLDFAQKERERKRGGNNFSLCGQLAVYERKHKCSKKWPNEYTAAVNYE